MYPSDAYAAKFTIGDKVEVYNTGGSGLKLRSCASLACSSLVTMPDGTQMTVWDGPHQSDGYTWWGLSGYVNNAFYLGYSAENWLRLVNTPCNYSISQTSQYFESNGGSGSVGVTSNCSWTATSNDTSWITITSGSSGSGNGTVYYSVSANTNSSQRMGTMTIAGQTFTVTQAGVVISCTDSYEPNDSSSTAYGPLNSGSNYSGKICTSSDVDWFKVNITSPGTIYVSLTVPYSNDYYVELYGPSYTWVAGNHDVSISYYAAITGTYYIRVLGYNGSYNRTNSYTLAYNFTNSGVVPLVTTGSATNITSSSVTLNGTVNANGLSTVAWFEYGTIKGSYSNTSTSELVNGSSDTTINIGISGLSAGTTYYYRCVGKNSAGITNGTEMSFTTSAVGGVPPKVTTGSATNITSSSATLNGTANANGLPTTAWFEYGKSSGSYSSKSSTQNVSGSSNTTVSIGISGLSAGTTYYRLVAQNSAGTTYGNEMSFKTQTSDKLPIVITGSPSNVTLNTATLNGTVNANGLSTTAWFEYGGSSGLYSRKSSIQSVSGTSNTPVSIGISGLYDGTTYYYRLAAQNNAGTSYGSEKAFTTEKKNLLGEYAPILYIHPEELYYPTEVEMMVENSDLCENVLGIEKVVKENGTFGLNDLMKDEYNKDKYYLRLTEEAKKTLSDKTKWKQRTTVYGHQFSPILEDTSKIVLQYWFFYVYNDYDDIHEGDWEMIQIILDDKSNPEKTTYSYHHGGTKFDNWNDVDKEGNHPIVYVALGGHGSWNRKDDNVWYQHILKCLECVDKTSKGAKLYPHTMSNSLNKDYKLIDIKKEESDWIDWKGYWGKRLALKYGPIIDEDVYLEFEISGPGSPPYIDYLKNDVHIGRWSKPITWANKPNPTFAIRGVDNPLSQ